MQSLLLGIAQAVVDWPPHHPHPVVGEGGHCEAGGQRQGVVRGDKNLADAFVPVVVGGLAPQLHHGIGGEGYCCHKDVRASKEAQQQLQRLVFLLFGCDAEDNLRVGQQS